MIYKFCGRLTTGATLELAGGGRREVLLYPGRTCDLPEEHPWVQAYGQAGLPGFLCRAIRPNGNGDAPLPRRRTHNGREFSAWRGNDRGQNGGVPITVVKSAVVGLVGIAPAGPVNEPVQILSSSDAAQFGSALWGFTSSPRRWTPFSTTERARRSSSTSLTLLCIANRQRTRCWSSSP